MATQKYNTASRKLLAQARAQLDRGDIRQVSEKGCGAAQMVKAVAEARGWPHRYHGLLTQAVETLAAETNDQDLADRFAKGQRQILSQRAPMASTICPRETELMPSPYGYWCDSRLNAVPSRPTNNHVRPRTRGHGRNKPYGQSA